MRIIEVTIRDKFLVFLLPAMIILQGCSGNDWARRINWPGIDIKNLPTETQFPGVPALILEDEGSIDIHVLSDAAFSVYDRHTIIKVFNSRGFKYANIAVPYGINSEVDEIEARTIGADGKITVLNPEKIYDVNLYPNFVFYSDQRAKIFTLPAVTEGCILEYRYRITIRSRTYGSRWRFQSEIPTLKSRFKLFKQSDWDIDYRIYGPVSEQTVADLPAGFKQSMVWEAGPLPALKSEVFMPPLVETGARLTIAPVGISSWSDLAHWYYNLVKPNMDKRGELSDLADSLTAHLPSDREKLKTVFEWTRDKLRYLAVEIGIGGYQPSPVEEVFYERYGDCKDMTTLLCALADEIGIPVYQALISTRQNGLPDTTLPAATQFNHVIAYAPTTGPNGLWMDVTDKSCAFGTLPWYDQDVPVLFIGPDGAGKLMRTPGSNPSDNLAVTDWQIVLDHSGSAVVNAHTISYGIIANELRNQLQQISTADHMEWLELTLEERCPGAQIDSFKINHIEEPDMPLEFLYTFKDFDFAELLPKMQVIRPGAMVNERLHTLFQTNKRLNPVRIQIPAITTLNLSIDLPVGWHPVKTKESLIQETVFGTCILWWEYTGTDLKATVKIITPAQEIATSAYSDFREHLDNSRKLLETPILITNSSSNDE